MPTAEFIQPTSLTQALALLAQYGTEAQILAGGASLVLQLREGRRTPRLLLSLGQLAELDYLRQGPAGLQIGARTLLRDIERSALVRRHYPGLAQACAEVGNVRIRNQATLGGNLADADYASDPPAMLLALDARLQLASRRGTRELALGEFYQGAHRTVLAPDELITAILVPTPPPDSRMRYLKVKSRSLQERPCLGVAVVAAFEQGRCRELRLGIGAACTIPQRLPAVEALARGQQLGAALIAELAAGCAAGIETIDDVRASAWYRSQLIRVYVRRALMEVRDGSW